VTDLTGLPMALMTGSIATRLGKLSDPEVLAGDLWLLSWDCNYLGLAFIAAAKPGFVLAWPVTVPGEPSFAPGLKLAESPLGFAVTLWPTRETGIGWHLLDHPLGRLLDPPRIQHIARAMDDGHNPGLPIANGSALDSANQRDDEAMVEHWGGLCFHTWPVERRHFLSQAKVAATGGSARSAASVLELKPEALRAFWTGVKPVTEEQMYLLAEALGVEPDELLGPDPLQEVLDRLAHPLFKQPILNAAYQSGLTEGQTRDAVRSDYALVARDDSLTVSDARLFDAIRRVAARQARQ
jgi:hypothetical protein